MFMSLKFNYNSFKKSYEYNMFLLKLMYNFYIKTIGSLNF